MLRQSLFQGQDNTCVYTDTNGVLHLDYSDVMSLFGQELSGFKANKTAANDGHSAFGGDFAG